MKHILLLICSGIVLASVFVDAQNSVPAPINEPRKPEGFIVMPNQISYQGLLTTSVGAPATDGSYNLQFDLFYGSVGGSSVWTETHSGVNVQHGTFSVILGSITTFPYLFFTPYYIQVTALSGPGIGAPVVFPRSALSSAPYALGPWHTWGYGITSPYYWVGIGTDTTYAPLTMNGPIGFKNSANPMMYIYQSGTSNADKNIISHSPGYPSYGLKYRDVGDQMIFQSAGTPVMSVDLNYDNVGIGVNAATPLPSSQLNVATSRRYGIYAYTDSLSNITQAIHGEYKGTDAHDGIGVYGKSTPIDYYGYGGYFWGNYVGAEGVVSPTGSQYYYGLYGSVSGGSGYNFGVDGYAYGGFANYGVYGQASGGAINYAGFFSGNLYVSSGDGDTSVVLPDNSISSPEILDEPGIARSVQEFSTAVSTSGTTDVTSISITVPAAGYIVAHGHAYVGISGSTQGDVVAWIDTTGTAGIPFMDYDTFGSTDEVLSASTSRFGSLAPERTFYAASAGTYTYYLDAGRGYTGGSAYIWNAKVVLSYYPTAYGSVSTIVSPLSSSKFDATTPMSFSSPSAPSGASSVGSSGQLYQVDLRELELKAAKARAAAQAAENELMKAQLQKAQVKNKLVIDQK